MTLQISVRNSDTNGETCKSLIVLWFILSVSVVLQEVAMAEVSIVHSHDDIMKSVLNLIKNHL